MSELTEQIKAKCATIAENQKKVYDLGFEKGKASVELIAFYVTEFTFVALKGMTWGELVASDVYQGRFNINNGKIYFESGFLGYSVDHEIVEKGYYEPLASATLLYNSQYLSLSFRYGSVWGEWVGSDFNTLGLYFDDNDLLRTPTGEIVFDEEGKSVSSSLYMYENYDYEAKNIGSAITPFEAITFDNGMTWGEYVDSSYNTGTYVDGDFVRHYAGDGAFYYNGVPVKPTDLIIDGAEYQYQ
jgi:hypothetical protein